MSQWYGWNSVCASIFQTSAELIYYFCNFLVIVKTRAVQCVHVNFCVCILLTWCVCHLVNKEISVFPAFHSCRPSRCTSAWRDLWRTGSVRGHRRNTTTLWRSNSTSCSSSTSTRPSSTSRSSKEGNTRLECLDFKVWCFACFLCVFCLSNMIHRQWTILRALVLACSKRR